MVSTFEVTFEVVLISSPIDEFICWQQSRTDQEDLGKQLGGGELIDCCICLYELSWTRVALHKAPDFPSLLHKK
jgi:hypothetical protein